MRDMRVSKRICLHLQLSLMNNRKMNQENMNTNKSTRRTFIKNGIAGSAALSIGGILPQFSPRSYGNIIGANERVNVGIMGVNNRGRALAKNFAGQPNSRVIHISDVDTRASARSIEEVNKVQEMKPADTPDFRK